MLIPTKFQKNFEKNFEEEVQEKSGAQWGAPDFARLRYGPR
jgi:hypothetical protein